MPRALQHALGVLEAAAASFDAAIMRNETKRQLVTEGNFTYVALDDQGRPRKVG